MSSCTKIVATVAMVFAVSFAAQTAQADWSDWEGCIQENETTCTLPALVIDWNEFTDWTDGSEFCPLVETLITGHAAYAVCWTPENYACAVDFVESDMQEDAAASLAEVSVSCGDERLCFWTCNDIGSRVLYTDNQIQQAQTLCSTGGDQGAISLKNSVADAADMWAAKTDQELHDLLPDNSVPRSINVSLAGCPVHGTAIYQGGAYPWQWHDATNPPDEPFIITCPIGNEQYNVEFQHSYDGQPDAGWPTCVYCDTGQGWIGVDPANQKPCTYHFVGYACLWRWRTTWLPAVTTLSQAYAMTGDPLYARKAIVMLDRIAEIYPGMNGVIPANGGKILDGIWESWTLRDLAIAYDLVYDRLVGTNAISLPWRSANEIRRNIEMNLLAEGIGAVYDGRIHGNYGMHQSALAYAAVVQHCADTSTNGAVDWIVNHRPGQELQDKMDQGLNYAWYNLVFKDGLPFETAPAYCFSWVTNFTSAALPLSRTGQPFSVYDDPKLRRMFDAPLDSICAQNFTPGLGDSEGMNYKWVGPLAATYKDAYKAYLSKNPPQPVARWAWAFEQTNHVINAFVETFTDLFSTVSAADLAASMNQVLQDFEQNQMQRQRSRLLDGYGLAVLNNMNDSLAVSMYYGIRGGHGHYDRLGIELFGHGRRLSPDLGRPDFTDSYCEGRFTWTNNTVSHNCLVVDNSKQRGVPSQTEQSVNHGGKVLRFHDSPTVHVVDVDAPGLASYDQTSIYRRTLVLVDVGDDDSYLVDVFRVKGGDPAKPYRLSIHGQDHGEKDPIETYPGTWSYSGPTLTNLGWPSLGGADVAWGELYDDAVLGAPGYNSVYYTYRGSGYQYLFNCKTADLSDEIPTGHWTIPAATVTEVGALPAAELRVHVVPPATQPATSPKLIVADAYVSPLKKVPTVLKYVLVQQTPDDDYGNTFVTVWEPAASESQVIAENNDAAWIVDRSVGTGAARTVALSVHRADQLVDTIIIQLAPGTEESIDATGVNPAIESDAAVTVITEDDSSNPPTRTRTFAAGGSGLSWDTANVSIPETITGTVSSVDYPNKTLTATVIAVPEDLDALIGARVRVFNKDASNNEVHSCIYTIDHATADNDSLTLYLKDSDVFTGRIYVSSVNTAVVTYTPILYPYSLLGMHLASESQSYACGPITAADVNTTAGTTTIQLAQGPSGLTTDADAWIADFGIGDSVEIERSVYDELPPEAPTNATATPDTVCPGNASQLSATPGARGNVVQWYTDSCGGTYVDDGSPSVAPSATTTYYARSLNTNTGGVSGTCASVTVTVRTIVQADFDSDCDVDMEDFTHFSSCYNGPNRPPAHTGCDDANLDGDAAGDVDMEDFTVFNSCYNGPNKLPRCD